MAHEPRQSIILKPTTVIPIVAKTGEVRWSQIFRKFMEQSKEKCNNLVVDRARVHKTPKVFTTGSHYEGTWGVLGMSGSGIYTFIHDNLFPIENEARQVITYEGDLEDGTFHGEGLLRFEYGIELSGTWVRGALQERKLIFDDGLEFTEEGWKYCRMPDRRYTIEYDLSIQPAGISFITNDQPSIEIPDGYYDAGIGFYCPKQKVIYRYDDLTAIIKSPSASENNWIIANCRRAPDLSVGPLQYFYEEWLEPQPEMVPLPPPPCRTVATDNESFDEDWNTVSFGDIYTSRRSRVSEMHKRWKNRSLLRYSPSKVY